MESQCMFTDPVYHWCNITRSLDGPCRVHVTTSGASSKAPGEETSHAVFPDTLVSVPQSYLE